LLLCEEIYSRRKKNPNEIFYMVIKKDFLMMSVNGFWILISHAARVCSIMFQLIAAILLKDAGKSFGRSRQKRALSVPFSWTNWLKKFRNIGSPTDEKRSGGKKGRRAITLALPAGRCLNLLRQTCL